MPIDRPTAAELLQAVRQHLMDNLAPTLEGQPAFHLRVATNALAIVERTMADGEAMDEEELTRLQELLDSEGGLLNLNTKLVDQIRTGELDDKNDAVLDHLRKTSVDKLRLSNPRYMVPRD